MREPRAGHVASVDDGDHLIVFGGFNMSGYLDSRYLAINFNQREVADFVYQINKRQKEERQAKLDALNNSITSDGNGFFTEKKSLSQIEF